MEAENTLCANRGKDYKFRQEFKEERRDLHPLLSSTRLAPPPSRGLKGLKTTVHSSEGTKNVIFAWDALSHRLLVDHQLWAVGR